MLKKMIFSTALAATLLLSPVTITHAQNVDVGEFKITYYWPGEDQWGYQTATGVTSSHLYTCAVDPEVIPLGTTLMIDGWEYIAVDVGGAVKGNVIDIFTEHPIHEMYYTDVEIVR